MDTDAILQTETPYRQIVLVCRKCTKKLDGGFGHKGRQPLQRALKEALREAGRRREVRVIEVNCLGLCPKRAVALVNSARPQEMLAIPGGTDAGLVLARITPAPPAAP